MKIPKSIIYEKEGVLGKVAKQLFYDIINKGINRHIRKISRRVRYDRF